MRFAWTLPMPLMRPQERKRRMPSVEAGATQTMESAWKRRPYWGWLTHLPVAVSSSPTQIAAQVPTTVTVDDIDSADFTSQMT